LSSEFRCSGRSIWAYGCRNVAAFDRAVGEKGAATKVADEFQATKANEAAKFGRLQADLNDVTAREWLNTTLGNIDAIRAAAHIDPTSPTTQAVEQWQTQISERQRLAASGTLRAQASADDASAEYLRTAGAFAQQQSYLKAGIDVLGAASKWSGSAGAGSLGTGGMGLPAGAAAGGLYQGRFSPDIQIQYCRGR
jgi:hypothetical protein